MRPALTPGVYALLRFHLCDDLFRLALRHFFIVRELHRVHGASLRHRAQLRRVPEHLGQRHRRADRSPSTSPMNASGVTTSTFIIGSRITGCARLAASLYAIEPAILNAIS